jgi:hypothetical protein
MPSKPYDPYDPDQRRDAQIAAADHLANKRRDTEWAVADLKTAAERDRNADALGILTSEVSDSTDEDSTDEDVTDEDSPGDLAQPAVDPLRPSLADLFAPRLPDAWGPRGIRTTETPTSDRSPPPDGADAT